MQENRRDNEQQGAGRLNDDTRQQNTSGTSRDISEVDQQEGNMNNGALGGNLDQEEADLEQQRKEALTERD